MDCFLEQRNRPSTHPNSHVGNIKKESHSHLSKTIPLRSSSQNESSHYISLQPDKEDSENSGDSDSGSTGYEEIPRTNAIIDVKTATARGHREVYSLSSWDDDTVTTKESDK